MKDLCEISHRGTWAPGDKSSLWERYHSVNEEEMHQLQESNGVTELEEVYVTSSYQNFDGFLEKMRSGFNAKGIRVRSSFLFTDIYVLESTIDRSNDR